MTNESKFAPVKPNFLLVGLASNFESKSKSSRQAQVQGEVVSGHIELNGQGSQPRHKSGKPGRAEDVIPDSAKNV